MSGVSGLSGLSGLSGVAGGSFTPLALPNLIQWFRADAGTFTDAARTTPAISDTNPIGGWADQSGAGNHVSQSTAGSRPYLKLNQTAGGRPTIMVDGSNDHLIGTDGLFDVGTGDYTGFAYVRAPTFGGSGASRWFAGNLTNVAGFNGVLFGSDNTNHYRAIAKAGGVAKTAADPSAHIGDFVRFIAVRSAGTLTLYINGISVASIDGSGAIDGESNVLFAARTGDQGEVWKALGDLGQWGFCTAAITPAQVTHLDGYLATWGAT